MNETRLLSVRELADLLGVSRQFIYESVKNPDPKKRIPCLRVGKHYRFIAAEVIGWLKEQHGNGGTPENKERENES